jgi:hypothetical protein
MAPRAESNAHKNLLRNHCANCKETLREWSLDDPLPTKMAAKLRIEKRGMKLKKNLLL